MSDNVGQSYNEQILQSIIDGKPYVNENPYPSRIEQLLMELKTAIEQGGSVIIDTQVNGESTNPVQNRAIYNFVNSSVATNTANFKGTYNSLAELQAVTDATNNDYAFVTGTDSSGNTYFDRYKYNGSEWVFEYELNNSSFTAVQWATIQSGLTAADKTKLDGIEAQANKTVVDNALSDSSTNPVQNKVVKFALDSKQNTLTTEQLAAVNSGITSTDVAQIETNKNNILYNTNKGVKNTFDFANAQQEDNRYITFIKTSASLTVTANNPGGGSSSVTYSGKNYPAGDYIFSCKITDYSCTTETAKIYIATSTAVGTGIANKTITGNGTIQIPFHWNGGKVYIKYFPHEGSASNQSNTFTASENMIMLASVSDTTYQPYAMSNAELTAAIQALQAQLANQ